MYSLKMTSLIFVDIHSIRRKRQTGERYCCANSFCVETDNYQAKRYFEMKFYRLFYEAHASIKYYPTLDYFMAFSICC